MDTPFEEMVLYQRNLLTSFFYYPTPVRLDRNMSPWEDYAGSFNELHPEIWIADILDMLKSIDFIFVTENLKELVAYFECRHGVTFREGEREATQQYTITKKQLTMSTFDSIYSLNSLDLLLHSHIHKIRESQVICPP